ncbi:hypothetical protein STRAU_6709 [Streptomyces aurantiacus JA 4570]|uniref:Uncharacterized protein n=1 Tax=Streptomyces aurantiacus JA 4570 TaxID=1286094 RepID=S3ZPD9_9ACTN|nr:hypothetical protein STRAU_6709 [Streptomyces aurantiacus JA 4570]
MGPGRGVSEAARGWQCGASGAGVKGALRASATPIPLRSTLDPHPSSASCCWPGGRGWGGGEPPVAAIRLRRRVPPGTDLVRGTGPSPVTYFEKVVRGARGSESGEVCAPT